MPTKRLAFRGGKKDEDKVKITINYPFNKSDTTSLVYYFVVIVINRLDSYNKTQ